MSASLLLRRLARRRARRDDRGAALIELAICVPILFLVCLSIVEASLGWRAVVQVNDATRAGARADSKAGKVLSADFDALSAIKTSLPTDLRTNLNKIIVYKATTASDTVPSTCLSATAPLSGLGTYGVSGLCNVYTRAQFNSAFTSTNFGCSGKWDNNWCPSSRNDDPNSGATGTMDYVGVYIETVHKNVTGAAFWSDNTITRQVVNRLEPPYGS